MQKQKAKRLYKSLQTKYIAIFLDPKDETLPRQCAEAKQYFLDQCTEELGLETITLQCNAAIVAAINSVLLTPHKIIDVRRIHGLSEADQVRASNFLSTHQFTYIDGRVRYLIIQYVLDQIKDPNIKPHDALVTAITQQIQLALENSSNHFAVIQFSSSLPGTTTTTTASTSQKAEEERASPPLLMPHPRRDSDSAVHDSKRAKTGGRQSP